MSRYFRPRLTIRSSLAVIALAALPAVSFGQNVCSSQRQCIITLGGVFNNSASCTGNYVQEIRQRFLASHFDQGTPDDFTDDPIVFGFAAGLNIFGEMQGSGAMALPSVGNLQDALAFATENDVPFVIQMSTWGCQRACNGQVSGALSHLKGFRENYMLSPEEASSGSFPRGMDFFWCSNPQGSVLTYPLHPQAGHPTVGSNLGLQDLIDRNLGYIANWIKTNIYDIPENRKYLVGIVISGETHFGSEGLAFDYSDSMLTGYRESLVDAFGCDESSSGGFFYQRAVCDDIQQINSALGTNFADVESIIPPTDQAQDCSSGGAYCQTWNDYRVDILRSYLARIASTFSAAGIPAGDLYTHELVAAGGFLPGPLEVPGANPGLSAYSRSDHPLFTRFSCPGGANSCPNHRRWAVVEGYFPSCGSGPDNDPSCYASSFDDYFGKNAGFLHQMPTGVNGEGFGEKLLGSNLEKGIHLWGMPYSSKYDLPFADLNHDVAAQRLRGCIYDDDQVLRGPFNAPGSTASSTVDANDIRVRVEIAGQLHYEDTQEVESSAPWCGTQNENFSLDLSGQPTTEIRVLAQDYPSDEWIEVFCLHCDDQEPPHAWIDDPFDNETTSGSTRVKGWAVDNSAISASHLTFSVDGQVVQLSGLIYGQNRSDACSAHPGPNCPNVGFVGWLDTTGLSNGSHLLELEVTDASGNSTTRTRTFSVQNQGETEPPNAWIDDPFHQESTSGSTRVKGWAVDNSMIDASSLAFSVDGQSVQLSGLQYGDGRADVCNTHPGPNCPDVGFVGWLDTTALANGAHVLEMTVTDPHGNSTSRSRSFTVDNPQETEAPNAWIEAPGGSVSGSAHVQGWAVDNSSISSSNLAFAVDGQPVSIDSLYYGVARSDVCQVHPGPNCPNVGFRGWLDTTGLSNGSHTVELTVTDPFGNSVVRTTSFTVAN